MTTDAQTAKRIIRDVPIDQIGYHLDNHRHGDLHDQAKLDALADSIERHGLLQPVLLQECGAGRNADGTPYSLVYGHRRFAAIKQLGWETIPAEIRPPMTDAQVLLERAIENLHRQDIRPMEEVIAVGQLLGAAMKANDASKDPYDHVAAQLGKSVRWVRDRDYLHRLHPAVGRLALSFDLPAGHLREIAKIGDPALQLEVAIEAAGGASWYVETDKSLEAGELVGRSGYSDSLKDWQARAAEGSYHRQTLRELEDRVAAAQKSLRSVPWELDQPIQDKKTDLPACAGCPHNSATDRLLFGLAESEDPRGTCLNPGCFAAKQEAVESIKDAMRRSLIKRKTEPKNEQIDAATPAWMRQTTARGFVKRERKKIADNGGVAPEPRAASGGGRKLTDHEQALKQFEKALEKWSDQASKSLMAQLREDPQLWALCCTLSFCEAWPEAGWNVPHVSPYAREENRDPAPPEPMDAEVVAILRSALDCRGPLPEEIWQRAAALPLADVRWMEAAMQIRHWHPDLIGLLSTSLDLPPAPTWSDFDPAGKKGKA